MRKPKKSKHHGKDHGYICSLPAITPRASSASTVLSNATNDIASSDQLWSLNTGAARTRRRRTRTVDCGLDITSPLTVGLFRRVLLFLPAKDIVHECSLVCKSWLTASKDQKLWQLKSEQEKKYIPGIMGPPPKNFMLFYFRSPYTTNLLRNTHASTFCNVNSLSSFSPSLSFPLVLFLPL